MHTLLIADDEQLERDAIAALVKRNGLPLETIKARNGREAVEIAQSKAIDIALLDIRMPGISGIEAAKRIHQITPRCRIVFLTAWNSFDFAQEAIRIGAKDYLVKPATPQDVISLLSRLLAELSADTTETEKQNRDEARTILKLFNRSFFAAIKYGIVSWEAMRSYFDFEGIRFEQGLACIVDGIKEDELSSTVQGWIHRSTFQACYFPAIDRISILLFSSAPQAIALDFQPQRIFLSHPQCHVGLGRVFTDVSGIPASLSQASQAYIGAVRTNRQLVRFDEVPSLETVLSGGRIDRAEQDLVKAVLEGNREESRRLAHELQDIITCQARGDEQQLFDRMYELVLVNTKHIKGHIPHFSYEQLQRTTLLELEWYFMDFIDAACTTIALDRKDKYARLFQSMCSYIDTHYAEQLSLEHMAEMAGISTSYFSRLFHEYIGFSFIDYLTSVRIHVAKQMICTGMKMQEVAARTGFSDYSYFFRVFRTTEGLSPREFQQKQKKEILESQ